MSGKLFSVASRASLILVSIWCLVTIRDLDTSWSSQPQENSEGRGGAEAVSKAIALGSGHDSRHMHVKYGSALDEAVMHEEMLAMTKSPEIQFPCAQVWYLVTFLAGIASLMVTLFIPEHKQSDSAAFLHPMLYASWATSGMGLPCLAAEFLYSYGLPKCARPLLIAMAPPILFYQTPKYFSLIEQYNDFLMVCSLQSLTLLAIFAGNGSLLLGCILLAAGVLGFGTTKFPKDGFQSMLLATANILFMKGLAAIL